MTSILSVVFPTSLDLINAEPEDLAGILIEIIPKHVQASGFVFDNLLDNLEFQPIGPYLSSSRQEIHYAIAAALSWLITQGLVIRNPEQPHDWYVLTRRGREVKGRADLETYVKGRALPRDLLQESLANKVVNLFLRGDHDVAVLQAFKEVEVAVRIAGHYDDKMFGTNLMQAAFNPDTGPLSDKSLVLAERQAEMFLFVGAIGHGKNPVSHRDVNLSRETAARLIIFASHLLDIVNERAACESLQ